MSTLTPPLQTSFNNVITENLVNCFFGNRNGCKKTAALRPQRGCGSRSAAARQGCATATAPPPCHAAAVLQNSVIGRFTKFCIHQVFGNNIM